MKRRLKFYLIMFAFTFIALSLSKPVYAEDFQTWPAKTKVIHEKEWTLKFNKPLKDISEVTNRISVSDSKGISVSIRFAFGSGKNEVKILPPDGGYLPGETYTLTIKSGISSQEGYLLTKPVKMPFTIELPLNEELKPVENRKLFEDTYLTANYNIDLLHLAGAVGADFKHSNYLPNESKPNYNSNPIVQKAQSYFEKYTSNDTAKQINAFCSSGAYGNREISTFSGRILEGVASYDQLLKDSLVYKGPEKDTYVTRTATLGEIVDLLKKFSQETDAEEFFKENRELYEKMLNTYADKVNFDYVKRLKEFYGQDMTGKRFQIILSPTIAGGQSFNLEDTNGTLTYINMTNPSEASYEGLLNVLYHETAHNFFSVIKENNIDLINKYSQYSNALGDSSTFEGQFNETLARAVTAVMLDKYHGKIIAKGNITKEMNLGWKNLDNIYFLIKNKYLTANDKYPTFEKFLPVILEYVKAASLNQSFDIGPKEDMISESLILGGKEDCNKFSAKFYLSGKQKSASLATQSDIESSEIIALLDYPERSSSPSHVAELFKDMKGSDSNFINIKYSGDKLLIYIKGESLQKVLDIINKTDNIYIEKYQAY